MTEYKCEKCAEGVYSAMKQGDGTDCPSHPNGGYMEPVLGLMYMECLKCDHRITFSFRGHEAAKVGRA